jgi:hypothetical protein
MNDDLIPRIQAFTLSARVALEAEASQQLEGIYGWLPDGTFGDGKGYPAIAQLPEAALTRQQFEQFAEDEMAAGLVPKDARRKLVREAAFTWLNRLAAFRLMEERRLLKQTIVRLGQSNGFVFWVVADGNEASRALHDQGSLPLNAMGEGPSDVVYRRFLLWQCGELAREVSVLFDPATLASRLCPRPLVLQQLVADMNVEALAEAWEPGNEETVGWIYQGFNTAEKAAVFASFQAGKKITAETIGPATQIFTPRWVVRYLVENTLGRLWVEMHPDSRLKESLAYLVPAGTMQARPLKMAREIRFLDPCCGSMHFGLVAFDLFAEMYREELERAGQPGWPQTPSASSEEGIPGLIVAHNIHGIDLDLRAVQISALVLLLRARALNSRAEVTDANLACANVEQITGGRLEEFVQQARFSHPIYERILRALARRLKNSDHLGSLLRIEADIEHMVAAERKLSAALLSELPGLHPEQFATEKGVADFFDVITHQILRHLDLFVQASRTEGHDAGMFAAEAAKGLRFLRLAEQRYDVVATNPPYLDSRDYSAVHKAHLEDQFPSSKRNLFAAFIQRCLELVGPQGLVGMITGQSFMFISSYEKLRADLLDGAAIETLAQFDYHLFKERVDTAAFVFRRELDERRRQEQLGVYFRLVREPDSDSKRCAFEAALASLRGGQLHPLVFRCTQRDFDAIPGKPWVYWIGGGFRDLFERFPLLGSVAPAVNGLTSSDNFRFVRWNWETGVGVIERRCLSKERAALTGARWFPYMKGGTPIGWFGNQSLVINWHADGAEIKNENSFPRSQQFYFRRGVTWSLISSKGFAARLSPGGFIFDVAGMTCFPPEKLIELTLAVLNSREAKFILSALNPTINYQVGDIERLPVPSERSPKIADLVNKCVELARQDSLESETTYDFIQPLRNLADRAIRQGQLRTLEAAIDAEVSRLYGLSDEDLAAIDRELTDGIAPVEGELADDAEAESQADDDAAAAIGDVTPAAWARSWVSYAFGTVLGRFEIGKTGGLGCGDFSAETLAAIRQLIDPDGIMASDPNHPQDIIARILACLELMLGHEEARACVFAATGGGGDTEDLLRDWIDRQFWKYHYPLHRKRPVYWPLQSPKKKFTIWVFQERFTQDTLFRIRSGFVEPKAWWLEARIKDLKGQALSREGRERRAAEKEASQLADLLDDVQEFAQRLNAVTQRGYTPHVDDGVLLNAAPLWELLPSWPDAKKAWQGLEAGEYDWAQQAMEFWPERVKDKCRTNKSFAIAHGLA